MGVKSTSEGVVHHDHGRKASWPSSLESQWATLFIALNLFVRHALADGWVWLVTGRGVFR